MSVEGVLLSQSNPGNLGGGKDGGGRRLKGIECSSTILNNKEL